MEDSMKHEFEYDGIVYYDPAKGLSSCTFKCKKCGKETIFKMDASVGAPWTLCDSTVSKISKSIKQLDDCDEYVVKSIMEK